MKISNSHSKKQFFLLSGEIFPFKLTAVNEMKV